MNNEELIIEFVKWLRARGIYLMHIASLTTATTEKGDIQLIKDFLEERKQ